MKFVRRLLVVTIAALPIIAMATAVAAEAFWSSSFFGAYQPERPKD